MFSLIPLVCISFRMLLFHRDQLISSHWSLFIPPEYQQKTRGFLIFPGVWKETSGMKFVKGMQRRIPNSVKHSDGVFLQNQLTAVRKRKAPSQMHDRVLNTFPGMDKKYTAQRFVHEQKRRLLFTRHFLNEFPLQNIKCYHYTEAVFKSYGCR